jgi:hypothetical protein
MPGFGMIPARGKWEERWFEVNSTATFSKGALVQLDNAYRVREYASTDSSVLGISAQSSTASRSYSGLTMVGVYLPIPGCTALSDLTTGISNLSVGQIVCAYKQGNLMSYASTVVGQASRFSAIFQIVGPIDSARSQIEVAFTMAGADIYTSASSLTFTA